MALPLSNNAEGGSNGTTLTAANSGGSSGDAFDTVTAPTGSGGSFTYSTDHPAHGSLGWKMVCPTSSGFPGDFRYGTSLGTITEVYGRIYTYRDTNNADTHRVFFINSAGSRRAEIDIGVGANVGKLRVLNTSNTLVQQSTNTLPLSEIVRIEFHFLANATTGRIEAKFFHGDDTTEIESIGFSDTNTGADANRIDFWSGPAAVTSGYTWYADDFALSATGWIGPATTTRMPNIIINQTNLRW